MQLKNAIATINLITFIAVFKNNSSLHANCILELFNPFVNLLKFSFNL